jgi:hypothetical protein
MSSEISVLAFMKTLEESLDAGEEFEEFRPDSKLMNALNGSMEASMALHKLMLHERVELTLTWSERYGAVAVLNDITGTWKSSADTAGRAHLQAMLMLLS